MKLVTGSTTPQTEPYALKVRLDEDGDVMITLVDDDGHHVANVGYFDETGFQLSRGIDVVTDEDRVPFPLDDDGRVRVIP